MAENAARVKADEESHQRAMQANAEKVSPPTDERGSQTGGADNEPSVNYKVTSPYGMVGHQGGLPPEDTGTHANPEALEVHRKSQEKQRLAAIVASNTSYGPLSERNDITPGANELRNQAKTVSGGYGKHIAMTKEQRAGVDAAAGGANVPAGAGARAGQPAIVGGAGAVANVFVTNAKDIGKVRN